MADIFVSYANQDRDVAFRIVTFLEEQGISCWVAPVRSAPLPPPRRSHTSLLVGAGLIVVLAAAAGAWWYAAKTPAPTAPVATAPTAPAATPQSVPAPVAQSAPAPTAAPAPAAPPAAAPAAAPPVPAVTASVRREPEAKAAPGPKRNDLAFVTGSWCQPYQGMTIRYKVMRTGPDTILTQVDHPQSPGWEVITRIKVVKDGFEFQPVDTAPDDKNIARFTIVDDSMLKLVRADGEAQDGPIRVRCPASAR